MIINGFELKNHVKVERAKANLGGEPEKEALLAEYDRLGGGLMKDGQQVKTGSFYDFKSKKAHAKPQVVFVFSVNGRVVEVAEGEPLPGIVRAAKMVEEEDQKERAKTAAKKRAAKGAADTVEEDASEEDE